MRRAHPLLPIALLAALAACTPRATVPDVERERVDRELSGRQRYLRVAAYASPLWGDRSKLLLSDQPGTELELLETAGGEPIRPPAAERVLPPGTPVRIARVEFPNALLIAQRVVMTPRYHPWVVLESGADRRPLVLVLSQTASTFEDVRAEVDRLLTDEDPGPALAALPPEQRDAVLRKEPIEGMDDRALEMAWGLPIHKLVDRPAGTETWTWPGGRRKAFLRDGRVERVERTAGAAPSTGS